ncbi:hypothetical protein LWI29_006211 [Acer saccharum]|uniref:Uncharacterized protein n=1 Tax=Acer saccharum TaxID=4024 RepID=A0AA39SRS3_ACESA|nr:hypothetical protein LWI29_006211 [Acer saccharum]
MRSFSIHAKKNQQQISPTLSVFCINSMAVAVSSPAFVSGDDFPADYGEWFPKDSRRAGVLLHPTSFPGPYSIVEEAFRFIDWLLDSGWSLWLFGRGNRREITCQLLHY